MIISILCVLVLSICAPYVILKRRSKRRFRYPREESTDMVGKIIILELSNGRKVCTTFLLDTYKRFMDWVEVEHHCLQNDCNSGATPLTITDKHTTYRFYKPSEIVSIESHDITKKDQILSNARSFVMQPYGKFPIRGIFVTTLAIIPAIFGYVYIKGSNIQSLKLLMDSSNWRADLLITSNFGFLFIIAFMAAVANNFLKLFCNAMKVGECYSLHQKSTQKTLAYQFCKYTLFIVLLRLIASSL